jgi:hypothetical protein
MLATVTREVAVVAIECPKTEANRRAVPLQTIALEALEQQQSSRQGALVLPAQRGGYLDLHNFCNREWKPAQVAAGKRFVPGSPPSISPVTWAPA